MKRAHLRSVVVLLAVLAGLLGAVPASAEDACAPANVALSGFPAKMGGQVPYFYVAEEGPGTTFQIAASDCNHDGPYVATVDYDTPPGSPNPATAGSDYTRVSGTETFSVTEEVYTDRRTITVPTAEDTSIEPLAEEVDVKLTMGPNADAATPSTAPLFVVDEDGATRVRFVSGGVRTVSESFSTFSGPVKIPVLRAGPTGGSVSFTVDPASASDVTPTSGTITDWTADGRLGVIDLTIQDDSLAESTETFTIALSGATVPAGEPATTTLQITDGDTGGGTHTLTVNRSGTGSGTVTSSPAGIDCGSDCSHAFNSGTTVTLTAAPAGASVFAGWSGACTGTATTCTVTMNAAKTVSATFDASSHTLSVSKTGTGSGTVTSSPAGISCGADCSESFSAGTTVTLTAAPASGSIFAGWSGACGGTAATCTLTMDAAKTVSAAFDLQGSTTHTLTVSRTGTGSGTVTSSPPGITCGADCSQAYDDGTTVTLSASAASGSTFLGWSGDCAGTGSCLVTMSQARNVTARFDVQAPTSHTLTVSTAGSGSGTVSSSPGGVSCPGDCSQSYTAGSSVTLSASPAAGSDFSHWEGDCASASGTSCTVAMNGARSVTAWFVLEPTPLPTWLHHPKHGETYRQYSMGADTIHVFVREDPENIARVEAALRKNGTGGGCQWWNGSRWATGACSAALSNLLRVTEHYPNSSDVELYLYDGYPSLRPSVGTRIRNYTVYARSTDTDGNISTFVTGESRNTFEVAPG